MITLLIIFLAITLSGLGFWFYNKKQINSLSEKIDDKNAVINALKNHVEVSNETGFNPNDEWRGSSVERATNLTPTVEEVFVQKKKKNNNYRKKRESIVVTQTPTPKKQKQKQEQTNRPKKSKTPKNS